MEEVKVYANEFLISIEKFRRNFPDDELKNKNFQKLKLGVVSRKAFKNHNISLAELKRTLGELGYEA